MCLLSVTVASLSGAGPIIDVAEPEAADFTYQSACRGDSFQPHRETERSADLRQKLEMRL